MELGDVEPVELGRPWRRATELLETGMPVGEIARAVGYTQPAQFAKAFRRTFGTSPTQFRAGQAAASATGTRGAA